MNKRNSMRWAIVFAASLSGVAMCGAAATMQSASAADPAASASASAMASGSSSAMAPAGPPKRETPLEPLEKQSIPTEKSPLPKLPEWETAKQVEIHLNSYQAKNCKALLVREWLKVKCNMSVGNLWMHSGSEQGVAFWVQPVTSPEMMYNVEYANGGEVILPLRVGDRRLIQFFARAHEPCIGIGTEPSVMLDETWIEGEAGPTVVLR